MAELEVDQSNLPKVQEVCQGFAVLEDGALAHNLQEQEIEQFYSSNVQRNQLVQRDIREAKRLQDEEKQKVLMHQPQTTQQLEKLDSEYAQMIQEEIRRCAEEARRRELEDEEIAKRIQEEEEELCVRHRTTHQTQHGRDSSSVPAPPYSPRAAQTHHTEIHYQPPTRRWQHSLPSYSDIEENPSENRPGRSQSLRDFRPSVGIRRQVSRCSTTPTEEDNRSLVSRDSSSVSQRSRSSQLSGGWGDVVRLIKTDMNEQGYLSHSSEDELFEPVYKLERILKQKQHGSRKRPSRHGSVREEPSPTWHGDDGHRERLSERHVRFVDDRRRPVSFDVNGYRIIENELNPGRDVSSVVPSHNFKVQSGQTQGFQRNVSMRRSYHCDTRLSRRTSVREANGTHGPEGSSWANQIRPSSRFPVARMMAEREVIGGNQRQRAQSLAENERSIDGPSFYRERRVRRSQSERRQTFREETRCSSRWTPRFPSSSPQRSCDRPPPGAGLGVVGESAALDLGQLEQVLLDEELARRLQKEEERFVEESQMDSPRSVYPAGDFRVAQVAQDEEIARFIQKQEIRAKRRSQELDSAGPGQEFREDVCDRRTRGDRQVHRQRLDSEGLQSPTDDFTPDYQAHSPISRATHQQPIRNIAEELDPTFQRNDFPEASQINEANEGQASKKVSSSPIDEPAFIPPTKRQADKVGRAKAKEKKEQFKQKENCKTH